jgi:hypothetical protein
MPPAARSIAGGSSIQLHERVLVAVTQEVLEPLVHEPLEEEFSVKISMALSPSTVSTTSYHAGRSSTLSRALFEGAVPDRMP